MKIFYVLVYSKLARIPTTTLWEVRPPVNSSYENMKFKKKSFRKKIQNCSLQIFSFTISTVEHWPEFWKRKKLIFSRTFYFIICVHLQKYIANLMKEMFVKHFAAPNCYYNMKTRTTCRTVHTWSRRPCCTVACRLSRIWFRRWFRKPAKFFTVQIICKNINVCP